VAGKAFPQLRSVPQVRSQPLGRQVTDAIRHMILVGEVLPGQVVTQDRLAEALSVSTMPVREALQRLAQEGFVEAQPNRSFRIIRTSREDVEDVYRTHAFLAGELTARAATKGGPELAGELQDIHKQWRDADTPTLESLNWRFHRAINHAAQAPKLLLFLRNTIRFIPDQFYAVLPEWRTLSQRGHRDILRALQQQDADQARDAAERHVQDAGRLLIAHFTDMGYWTPPQEGTTGR
jgi:DNA-binding GntR family transcriptional regulator